MELMMKTTAASSDGLHFSPHHERGVVLFVALIAMVVMSLAGVALLRAVNSNTSVAGNLAFRQASIAPISSAIETANDALFYSVGPRINNPFNDMPGENYYASLRTGEVKGIPAVLAGVTPSAYPVGFQVQGPDGAGNTVRWVIERMCENGYNGHPVNATPDPLTPGISKCDLLTPKQSTGATTMKLGGLQIPPVPIYRVTVRVDGPANTVSFAQAMLR